MMAKLINQTSQRELIGNLEIAQSFMARLIGLLGRKQLAVDQALWIHRCNSIHTLGMQFPIDVVFVDRNLKVKSIKESVKPLRLILPVFGASSVFEMASGRVKQLEIKVGDQLHVGH